jgi:hypothetical protein
MPIIEESNQSTHFFNHKLSFHYDLIDSVILIIHGLSLKQAFQEFKMRQLVISPYQGTLVGSGENS